MHEELCALHFLGFAFKNGNKLGADDFAFGFGVVDIFQFGVKISGGTDGLDIEPNGFVGGENFFVFVLAKQTRIDKYAGLLATDGAVNKCGSHR